LRSIYSGNRFTREELIGADIAVDAARTERLQELVFACESSCNSFRGNLPCIYFPHFAEAVHDERGRRERDGFEPGPARGPVARATLYFPLRDPGPRWFSDFSALPRSETKGDPERTRGGPGDARRLEPARPPSSP